MPALSDDQWKQVRHRYEEDGERNLRQLSREFGVSDVAIRKRAIRDGWIGFSDRPLSIADADGRTIIPLRVTEAHKAELRKRAIENLNVAKENGLTEEENAQILSEMAVLAASDLLAEANAAQVERARRLGEGFQIGMDLVSLLFLTDQEAAALPVAQQERRKHAERLFMASENANLGQVLLGFSRLSESVQKQIRLALGQSTENVKPGSMRRDSILPTAPSPFNARPGPAGEDAFDLGKLSTEDLEKLYEAADIVGGRRKVVPFLVPPGAKPPEARAAEE